MVLPSLTSMPAMTPLETMVAVFTLDAHHLKSTMLFWLLAMALKMEKTSGLSRTLGDPIGVLMV